MNPWINFIEDITNLLKKHKPNFQNWKPLKQAVNPNPHLHENLITLFEKSTTPLSNISHIFEFGAGIGSLANIIQPFPSYTIFDFPQMIAIQAYNLNAYNITYISNIDHLTQPPDNSLFISSSALEEAPEHLFTFFLNYASSFSYFLFKFSGGKSKFLDFMKQHNVTLNQSFTASTTILCGHSQLS